MQSKPRIRRNIITLDDVELNDLRNAFERLYQIEGSQSVAPYQDLAGILIDYGHTQRNDMLFLPWARAYMYEFERRLWPGPSTKGLPYWDYAGPAARKHGIPAALNDPLYTDINTGETKPNPLCRAQWSKPLYTFRTPQAPDGLDEAATLAREVMQENNFIGFSTRIWPVDILSHSWIGGSSTDTATTAYDPIFWLSHCNLDRFWANWQSAHGNATVPESVKLARLSPFGMLGAGALDIAEMGYEYAEP